MIYIMKQIWTYSKKHIWKFFLIIICCGATMLIAFLRPLIVQWLIDRGLLQLDYNTVIKFCILLVIVLFLTQIIDIGQNIMLLEIRKDVLHKLYLDAFAKLLKLKSSYFEKENSAEVIEKLNTDISCAAMFLDQGFLYMISHILRIFSGIVGLFYINWQMSICIIGCIPIKLFFLKIISNKKEALTRDYINKTGEIAAWLSDRIMGITEIKLRNRYENENSSYSNFKERILNIEKRQDILGLFNTSAEIVIEGFMIVIFYLLGGYYVCFEKMSIGNILAFISYSANVTGPISALMDIRLMISNIRPSFERLNKYFSLEEETKEGRHFDKAIERIDVSKVSFSYGDHIILKDISFVIQAGERIALIGENGSGKSTILKLLLRFYSSDNGKILVNGIDINEIDLEDYRAQFSLITQFPYLFQETVRENLDFAGAYSDKEILTLLDKIGVKEVINNLPQGLDTVIGVNGSNLSGGEKQKLAFARMLLCSASVFVCDEGSSNYDQESEEWLYTEGLDLFRNKIIICITHQSKYLNSFDKVYRLTDGKLYEIDNKRKI